MEMRWERLLRNGLAAPDPVPPASPLLMPRSFSSPGVLGPSLRDN